MFRFADIGRRSYKLQFIVLIILLVQGCSLVPPRHEAVPDNLHHAGKPLGLEDIRFHVGEDAAGMRGVAIEILQRERAYLARTGHKGPLPPAAFLAISGGGDAGAFGAGLLNGWTKTGTRPEFKLVTGVSTGALIAPFAFLGPDYDSHLKEFYTTVTPDDIIKPRWLLTAIFSDALADNTPLKSLIEKYVDRDFLDKVAAEYAKGRLLLIATTDLDARKAVIWNMTRIATSRDPQALKLFRSIMLASAAVPGAMPPTMIDIEIGGKKYQEMHVDGGTMAQVFVYPPSINIRKMAGKHTVLRKRKLYIIRNSRLDPEWANVERSAMTIAGRAISSLIHSQGVGDLYRIYATAKRDSVDFNLAYIPASFDEPHKEEFDREFMQKLFALGYRQGAEGYRWHKTPPGYLEN